MINRNDMFLVKVALGLEEWQKERAKWRAEREKGRNIQRALSLREPKTYRERQVERLAGKQYTPGQVARGGAIGAGVGTAGHLIGSAIEGGRKGLAGAIRKPKQLLSSAVKGTLVGSIVPALKRTADVRAAEQGWY